MVPLGKEKAILKTLQDLTSAVEGLEQDVKALAGKAEPASRQAVAAKTQNQETLERLQVVEDMAGLPKMAP